MSSMNGADLTVDRQQFLMDGYLVIPEVIQPGMLKEVRRAYEILVEHLRIILVPVFQLRQFDHLWETVHDIT